MWTQVIGLWDSIAPLLGYWASAEDGWFDLFSLPNYLHDTPPWLLLDLFFDKNNGGYFSTEEGADNIIIRMKEDNDNAEPSPVRPVVVKLLLWR